MTDVGDLVLVYVQGSPAFFARIEDIAADVKPDWFHVRMLVLQVPLVVVTWILRRAYINGDEFTMGGTPMKMVKVIPPEEDIMPESSTEKTDEVLQPSRDEPPSQPESTEKGKVVSLLDRKKKGR